MIQSNDRSGWFGASDTAIIMGSWETKTFARWWLEKLGVIQNTYKSPAMMAGTAFEHKILNALGVLQRDRQIRLPELLLRVNLDGESFDTIREVKTYKADKFKISKAYWGQCQVQMFAADMWCQIDAYRLLQEDYQNHFLPIDQKRLSSHPISYDARWIKREYRPRIVYLAHCLRKGKTPCFKEFSRGAFQ